MVRLPLVPLLRLQNHLDIPTAIEEAAVTSYQPPMASPPSSFVATAHPPTPVQSTLATNSATTSNNSSGLTVPSPPTTPNSSSTRIEWVIDPNDGSVMRDHKNQPLSVPKLLATHPLKQELLTRPGPGGKQLTYLSGECISRTLNEVFGFDGWNMQVVHYQKEHVVTPATSGNGRYTVVYSSKVQLIHKSSGTCKEDIGVAEATDKNLGIAIENAIKKSITDAMKRAARHFGNKLGNSLYNKEFKKSNAPKTLKEALDRYDIDQAKTKFGFPKDRVSVNNNDKSENDPTTNISNTNNSHAILSPVASNKTTTSATITNNMTTTCAAVSSSLTTSNKTTTLNNTATNRIANPTTNSINHTINNKSNNNIVHSKNPVPPPPPIKHQHNPHQQTPYIPVKPITNTAAVAMVNGNGANDNKNNIPRTPTIQEKQILPSPPPTATDGLLNSSLFRSTMAITTAPDMTTTNDHDKMTANISKDGSANNYATHARPPTSNGRSSTTSYAVGGGGSLNDPRRRHSVDGLPMTKPAPLVTPLNEHQQHKSYSNPNQNNTASPTTTTTIGNNKRGLPETTYNQNHHNHSFPNNHHHWF